MKKGNILKEVFKDTRMKIASGIVAVIVVFLGVVYLVNPGMFKNIFGFSGIGQMGDYVVNDGVAELPVYYSIGELKAGDKSKAGRIMTESELFGLDGYVGEDGKANANGTYAKINFYNGEGGLARSWVGYITRNQIDTLSHPEGEVSPPPAKTYTVTFNSNGGTAVASKVVVEGSKLTEPTSTKANFTLTGWEFQPAFNCPAGVNCATVMPAKRMWNFGTDTVTANVTLTAQWIPYVSYGTAMIESITGNPTVWSNQDVVLTVKVKAGVPLPTDAYSFNNGADWRASNTSTYNTNQTVTVVVRDKTGKVSDPVTVKIEKLDKVAPVCTPAGGSTTWTDANVKLTGKCSDVGSGCKTPATFEKVISVTTNAAVSVGDVEDNAGNKVACPGQWVKIDKVQPTILVQKVARVVRTGTDANSAEYKRAYGTQSKCGTKANLFSIAALKAANMNNSGGSWSGIARIKINKGPSPIKVAYQWSNPAWGVGKFSPDKDYFYSGYPVGSAQNLIDTWSFENETTVYTYASFPLGSATYKASHDTRSFQGIIKAKATNAIGKTTGYYLSKDTGGDSWWNYDYFSGVGSGC